MHTLIDAHYLAWTLPEMGRYAESRDLDEDILDRRRRVLGHDHPDTLQSANSLAVDLRMLGEVRSARDLDQDTLVRYRRLLGQDHPAPCVPRASWLPICACWGMCRPRGTWTKTPLPAAAASWARTTPTPSTPPTTWPSTYANWTRQLVAREALTTCMRDPHCKDLFDSSTVLSRLRHRCDGSGHYARLRLWAVGGFPRGTVCGTARRIMPAQRAPPVRLPAPSVQLVRTMHEAVLLVNGRPAVRIRSLAPSSAGV